MARIVSVWLRAWPIARLLRAQHSVLSADTINPVLPLVLVSPGNGGSHVVGLNRAAQRGGLIIGDLLSNARAKVLDLQTRDADPIADSEALVKIAVWAMRYTPIVAPWDETCGADGLFLDIEGCVHLFGDEEALLSELARRLKNFGLAPRLAIADTPGASWAVARFSRREQTIIPSGEERAALCPLPIASLRLSPGALSLMRRLGLRRIADVIDQPRAPFAARFEGEFLQRLDQALGDYPEPLKPVVPPPVYRAHTVFLEPIISQEHVEIAGKRLLERLCVDLGSAQVGARVLRLLLFRVDGGVQFVDLGLAAPSRDPAHLSRLLSLRFDRLAGTLETEFGFDAIALHVTVAEQLYASQTGFRGEEHVSADGLACLVDRLQQRLGAGAVYQLHPVESHIPELAQRAGPVMFDAVKPVTETQETCENEPTAPRPLLLLPQPELAQVTALIPDGLPRLFKWRGVIHEVTAAQGPERISPEWWVREEAVERDYFAVEDTDGRRFWLYREGLYGQAVAPPRWFVHGLFS